MSTRYVCDRCSAPAESGRPFAAQFDVDQWMGDGSMKPRLENVVVQITITQPASDDFDQPDLCPDCRIAIVAGALDLMTRRQDAVRAAVAKELGAQEVA